jgi:acylphosphatase
MQPKVLYRIIVTGRVQGVGFRWNAAREAANLGISGYVKNLSDGSVYIEAEGTEEQLHQYVDWCRKGPGMSKVESVRVEHFPSVNYSDFKIEH